MSLVAAAVCPHPPMIVPEVAAGAAAELDDLRAACDTAVARLAASPARLLVVVGADPSTRAYGPDPSTLEYGADPSIREYPMPFHGSFRPWGVPVPVAVGARTPAAAPPPAAPPPAAPPAAAPPSAAPPSAAPPRAGSPVGQPSFGRVPVIDPERTGPPSSGPGAAPLSLLVGAWLVQRAFAPARMDRPVAYRLIGVADPGPARDLGAGLAVGVPWALLVLGDGSACRGPQAPGYDDPRAEPYDAAVTRALAGADADALLGLDPKLSAEVQAAGHAPWQVLGAAVRATGRPWRGHLHYAAAPYGVGYFVAGWEPA